jgi:hypothetical protein
VLVAAADADEEEGEHGQDEEPIEEVEGHGATFAGALDDAPAILGDGAAGGQFETIWRHLAGDARKTRQIGDGFC